jgi:hypothetical protein
MASTTSPYALKALELQSLDVESLFPALTAVEKVRFFLSSAQAGQY